MGMILSERQYQNALKQVSKIDTHIKTFVFDERLTEEHKELALAGERAYQYGIKHEIKEYENLKKGKIPKDFFEFENIGCLLIALRIKKGLNQTQMAELLDVAPSQVSRDENNEYYGVSTLTVNKILEALGETISLKLK